MSRPNFALQCIHWEQVRHGTDCTPCDCIDYLYSEYVLWRKDYVLLNKLLIEPLLWKLLSVSSFSCLPWMNWQDFYKWSSQWKLHPITQRLMAKCKSGYNSKQSPVTKQDGWASHSYCLALFSERAWRQLVCCYNQSRYNQAQVLQLGALTYNYVQKWSL